MTEETKSIVIRRGEGSKRENKCPCSNPVKHTNSALELLSLSRPLTAPSWELLCPHLLLLWQPCFQLLPQPTTDWLASDQ